MLVSPTRNSRVGGLNQRDGFCVAVEYRLNSLMLDYITVCIESTLQFFSCFLQDGDIFGCTFIHYSNLIKL